MRLPVPPALTSASLGRPLGQLHWQGVNPPLLRKVTPNLGVRVKIWARFDSRCSSTRGGPACPVGRFYCGVPLISGLSNQNYNSFPVIEKPARFTRLVRFQSDFTDWEVMLHHFGRRLLLLPRPKSKKIAPSGAKADPAFNVSGSLGHNRNRQRKQRQCGKQNKRLFHLVSVKLNLSDLYHKTLAVIK